MNAVDNQPDPDVRRPVQAGASGLPPLDLARAIPGYTVEIKSVENSDDAQARRDRESRKSLIADCLWAGLTLLIVVMIVFFMWVLFFKENSTPAQIDLSQKAIFSLVSGLIAFIIGRASNR